MPIGLYGWEINSYGFCWGKNHSIRNAFKTYLSVSNQCLSGKSQEQHRPATIIPISLFVVAKTLGCTQLFTKHVHDIDCSLIE